MDLLTLPAEPTTFAADLSASTVIRVRRRGEDREQTFPLTSDKCTIGSSPRCQIQLPAADSRPLQCLVALEADAAVVTRWAAGVLLNGREFSKAPLAAGDRLTIGAWEIELDWVAPQPVAPIQKKFTREPEPEVLEEAAPLAILQVSAPPQSTGLDASFSSRLTEIAPASAPVTPTVSPIVELPAAPPRSTAACQTYGDRVVLELWTTSYQARRRAKALVAAVRAARFQADAAAADLSAMETELDLARAAYDTQADLRDQFQQEVAAQQRSVELRLAPLAEELAALRTQLEESRAALTERTGECTRLSAALAATAKECESLRSGDVDESNRVAELEAALSQQTEQWQTLADSLQAAQAELTAAVAELAERTADWQSVSAQLAVCRAERDQLADELAAQAAKQVELVEAEERLAQLMAERAAVDQDGEQLQEQLTAKFAEVELLADEVAAAKAATLAAEESQQAQAALFAAQLAEIQRLELARADELQQALDERDALIEQLSRREADLQPSPALAGSEWSQREAPLQPEPSPKLETPAPVAVSSWSSPFTDEPAELEAIVHESVVEQLVPSCDANEADHNETSATHEEAASINQPSAAAAVVGESPTEFQSASFIDKYRHLLDEQDDAPPVQTAGRARPMLDEEFLSPAKVQTCAPDDDSDDALEAYMAGMMQRVRGDVAPSAMFVRTERPAHAVATTPVPRVAEPTASLETPSPLEPLEFEAMKLATRKQPFASDLAALREIANSSARTAIATHHERRHFESAVGKLTIAGAASFTSAYMMSSAPTISDWMFWAGAVLAGVGVIAAFQVLKLERSRSAGRKGFAAAQKAADAAQSAATQTVS